MRCKSVNFIFVGFFSAILGKVAGSAIPLAEVENNAVDNLFDSAGNNENLVRQGPTPSAVDSIEDAILAALEAAQFEETTRAPRPSVVTNRLPPVSIIQVTQQPQYQPQYPGPQQQQQPHPLVPNFGQFGIGGPGIIGNNRFPPIGHPLWSPLPALTATGPPAEYFGGIVGNLVGVADNTLKLVGSSTNTLLGVAGHLSCTLNPMCQINKG